MSVHEVTISQPELPVGNSDVIFVVREDFEKIGELHVSVGGLEWRPVNKQYKIHKEWSDIAAYFEGKA